MFAYLPCDNSSYDIQHLSCQRLILIGEHFDVKGIQKLLTQACVQCDATLERDSCMKECTGQDLCFSKSK